MKSASLKVELREQLGTRPSKKLRAAGRIPASIQSSGGSVVNISLDADSFYEARRHHQHLFDLELPGGRVETALVRELQWEVMTEDIVHIEFRRVVRGQVTEAEVELEFT